MKGLPFLAFVVFPLLGSVVESQAEPTIRQTFVTDEPFVEGETLIWTPAFQKCWDEAARSVGWESIPLKPETKYVRHLNNFEWDYDATVPKKSHFVFISGTGNQFLEQANELIRRHFAKEVEPLDETFFRPFGDSAELGADVYGQVFLSILKHDLYFKSAFKNYTGAIPFTGSGQTPIFVKAFGSWGNHRGEFAGAAQVMHYDGEKNRFTLSFPGAGKDESLILVQDDRLTDTGKTIQFVKEVRNRQGKVEDQKPGSMTQAIDTILVPNISLQHYQDFAELLRGTARSDLGGMVIGRAGQRIQLNLDKQGASMVTKAFLIPPTYLSSSGNGENTSSGPRERKFVFNRPFSLLLWRDGAELPFFLARIDLAALEVNQN